MGIIAWLNTNNRLRQRADSLENRIKQLPNEVQEEILQELAVVVTKREQESQEKEQVEETRTVEKLS